MKKDNWMQTRVGHILYPFKPDPDKIDIRDIASGLAKCCRWAGQCEGFFSVAQHSIIVSKLCSPPNALWGLMHDSPEAYTRDMIKPIKAGLGDYNELEFLFLEAIAKKFELILPIPDEVKEIDHLVTATESHYLMKATPEIKKEFPRVIDKIDIYPWEWQRAEGEYLLEATRLIAKRQIDFDQEFKNNYMGIPLKKGGNSER